MNTLTIAALRAYLDQLEATGFKVELLLLDHANCLAIDVDNFRLAFGRAMQDLEKLAAEKHIAIATAAQSNREGHKAKRVHIGHTGEDWSLPQTVDKVITLTRSEPEQRHGLGQLWVEKNRIGGQQHFGGARRTTTTDSSCWNWHRCTPTTRPCWKGCRGEGTMPLPKPEGLPR